MRLSDICGVVPPGYDSLRLSAPDLDRAMRAFAADLDLVLRHVVVEPSDAYAEDDADGIYGLVVRAAHLQMDAIEEIADLVEWVTSDPSRLPEDGPIREAARRLSGEAFRDGRVSGPTV